MLELKIVLGIVSLIMQTVAICKFLPVQTLTLPTFFQTISAIAMKSCCFRLYQSQFDSVFNNWPHIAPNITQNRLQRHKITIFLFTFIQFVNTSDRLSNNIRSSWRCIMAISWCKQCYACSSKLYQTLCQQISDRVGQQISDWVLRSHSHLT